MVRKNIEILQETKIRTPDCSRKENQNIIDGVNSYDETRTVISKTVHLHNTFEH